MLKRHNARGISCGMNRIFRPQRTQTSQNQPSCLFVVSAFFVVNILLRSSNRAGDRNAQSRHHFFPTTVVVLSLETFTFFCEPAFFP